MDYWLLHTIVYWKFVPVVIVSNCLLTGWGKDIKWYSVEEGFEKAKERWATE